MHGYCAPSFHTWPSSPFFFHQKSVNRKQHFISTNQQFIIRKPVRWLSITAQISMQGYCGECHSVSTFPLFFYRKVKQCMTTVVSAILCLSFFYRNTRRADNSVIFITIHSRYLCYITCFILASDMVRSLNVDAKTGSKNQVFQLFVNVLSSWSIWRVLCQQAPFKARRVRHTCQRWHANGFQVLTRIPIAWYHRAPFRNPFLADDKKTSRFPPWNLGRLMLHDKERSERIVTDHLERQQNRSLRTRQLMNKFIDSHSNSNSFHFENKASDQSSGEQVGYWINDARSWKCGRKKWSDRHQLF